MSNEQTVREAINAELACTCHPDYVARGKPDPSCYTHFAVEVMADDLGIDPDMSVSELQRRLRIAERVDEMCDIKQAYPDKMYRRGWNDMLAWLTREDDSPHMMTGIWPTKAGEGTHALDATREDDQ